MRFALEYLEQVPYEVLNDPPESQATPEEITARIGKYLVMEHLGVPFTDANKIKIARDEVESATSFIHAIKKSWSSRFNNTNGLSSGDIELAADELGVYEDIWPLDPEAEARAIQDEASEAAYATTQ